MRMPGFTADASIYSTSNVYRSVGSQAPSRDTPGVSPQFINSGIGSVIGGIFRWCRGCLVCQPRSGLCTCLNPCPLPTLENLM
jgi:hypothetical protein